MAEGFCLKCKTRRTIKDARVVVLKNKRKALMGKCAVCGTATSKFIK